MTKKIEIGKAGDGSAIFLDVAKFIRTRMLVQAASGQGKSHWLRRLIEQLAGIGIQVFVIDHEGEFATLRKKFDFFLAGEDGDLPVDIRTAAVTAHRFLEMRANCVFDLSEAFRSHPRDRHAWVKNFISSMMEAPKALWSPIVVVVDEAHKYMPEKDESEASEAMISLATDGRKREFCAVYATQRLSKLDKDGAAELLNKFIGGTSMSLDRKRAADEMGIAGPEARIFDKEIMEIDRGYFYSYGPAISKRRILVHVGETVTAAPAAGSRAAAPPPAPTKVKEMLKELGDLAKAAEVKLQTEKDYRTRIAELEKELRAEKGKKLAPPAPKTIAAPAVRKITDRELNEALTPLIAEHTDKVATWVSAFKENISKSVQKAFESSPKPVAIDWRSTLSKAAAVLNKSAGPTATAKAETSGKAANLLAESNGGIPARSASAPPQFSAPRSEVEARDGISRPMMRILKALRELEAIGQAKPSRSMTAFWSEASPTSSSFEKNVGSLNTAGLICYPAPSTLALTDAGRALAPESEYLSAAEVFARGLELLSAPEKRIMAALREAYPGELTRADLSDRASASHSSSSFEKNVGGLKTAGLLTYPSKGTIKAAEWLFF